MEKPVRILVNEKMVGFNEKVRSGLEHALNFMLSIDNEKNKVQIGPLEPFLMPIEAYLQAYQKKSVMIKVHSDKDYKSELYWFFEFNTAVVLGSIMRMMTPAAIAEKLAGGVFDANDQDAFGEVGNQLCGILDRAFRTITRKDIHLRMDFDKKVYPNEAIQLSSFRNEEEYVVFLANITIPKHGTQKLTLLLPRSLYEVMLNLEVALEGIEPKKVVIYSHRESSREQVQTQMNSRYLKVVHAEAPDDLFTMIDKASLAAVGIDLKKLTFPLGHAENILLKRLASNRALSHVPYFLTWEGATEEEAKILTGMGLHGTTTGSFAGDFSRWVKAIMAAPLKA